MLHGSGTSDKHSQNSTCSAAQIAEWLRVFIEEGQLFEMRIMNTPRGGTVSGYFDDRFKAVPAAIKWSGKAPGVYFTLNPINSALLARANNRLVERVKHTTSDDDVVGRHWLFLDFDPRRPSGISSTDTEHQAALDRARTCRDWLSGIGWPFPVEADSGNGAHLLYAISLPNDAGATDLVKRCLSALSFQFSDADVEVDCATHNAARLCKVYGTLSCKGDHSPDRPHRLSCVSAVPAPLVKVPIDLLQALASMAPPEEPLQPKYAGNGRSGNGSAGTFDLERWIRDHNLPVVSSGPWKGTGWRWILNPCPWNEEHNNRAAFIVRWPNGTIGAGCHHNGCQGKGWHELRAVYEPGSREKYNGQPDSRLDQPGPPPTVEIFTASDLLTMELPDPKWAVAGILPEGLSVFAGKPKLGKSWLALNIALAASLGGVAFGSIRVEQGHVLYLALEDTKRRLKSRLEKLLQSEGADKPDALHLARAWPRQDQGGLFALAEWIIDHRKTARLIVIDTWPKFRPGRTRNGDSYEEDYTNGSAVKALADRHQVAILAICHCRKLPATDPLDEVSGTLGLTGAADGVLVLRRERGQHDATLFVTGRDIDEQEMALRWDPQYALWSILGKADEYRLSKERQEVIELLDSAGKPLTPSEASPLLNKPPSTVKRLFWTMGRDGQIVPLGDGMYTSAKRATSANPT